MLNDGWGRWVGSRIVEAALSVVGLAGYGGVGTSEAALGEAPAAEAASYKGYAVVATKAERVGNVVTNRGYHTEDRLYAGDGHWLVTVSLRFEAVPAPASTAEFIVDDRTAYIGRSDIVLYDPSADASYHPSSWRGSSWLDWSREDEALKFNKEKTKADTTYLFRVPVSFDRKVSVLKLGGEIVKLSFKRQKWDKD